MVQGLPFREKHPGFSAVICFPMFSQMEYGSKKNSRRLGGKRLRLKGNKERAKSASVTWKTMARFGHPDL
jgi:hypothetical protein